MWLSLIDFKLFKLISKHKTHRAQLNFHKKFWPRGSSRPKDRVPCRVFFQGSVDILPGRKGAETEGKMMMCERLIKPKHARAFPARTRFSQKWHRRQQHTTWGKSSTAKEATSDTSLKWRKWSNFVSEVCMRVWFSLVEFHVSRWICEWK